MGVESPCCGVLVIKDILGLAVEDQIISVLYCTLSFMSVKQSYPQLSLTNIIGMSYGSYLICCRIWAIIAQMSSNKVKSISIGVFIDGANLFWAGRKLDEIGKKRWAIDFQKLKTYLKKRYTPAFFKFYDCTDDKPTNATFQTRAQGSSKFHKKLSGFGYDVILKPLKYIKNRSTGEITTKGDMDTSISVAVQNALNDIDGIILFSGDSDFLPVVQNAHSAGKFIRIFSFEHTLAWELKDFAIKNTRCNYKLLDEIRSEIEYTEKQWVTPNHLT